MEKKGTTFRLSHLRHEQLERAAYLLRKSKSQIVEDALAAYFLQHNLLGYYQLTVTRKNVVLLQITGTDEPRIVSITERNGTAPSTLADQYSLELHEPVRLVIQDEDHG